MKKQEHAKDCGVVVIFAMLNTIRNGKSPMGEIQIWGVFKYS
jgi:hypothetical protein